MKRVLVSLLAAAFLFGAGSSSAGEQRGIMDAVIEEYPPAVWHRALDTAYEEPQPEKMRGYAVVERGGIPAERATFFISWSDYDYRGVVVRMDGSDRMSTRRGAPYTWLARGDVMVVAGVKQFRDTVYLKLISSDVYVPENRRDDKRHSRVTVMLGFKFPKDVMKKQDAEAVLQAMGGWVKPFKGLAAANSYAESLAVASVPSEKAPPVSKEGDERLRSIEQRIDAARRDLESAEKELKGIKGEGAAGSK